MGRASALVLVCAMCLAGCAGGVGAGDVGAGGGEDEGDRPSFTDRLAVLPPIPAEASTVEVRMVDVDRAAELAALDWPPPDDSAAVDAISAISAFGTNESAAPVWAPMPDLANIEGSAARQSEFATAAGWSLPDLDWFAEVLSPPHATMVGGGRVAAEALHDAHGGTAEGPWRTSDLEDLEQDLEGDRLLDMLGRPLTLAVDDGVLGVSRTGDGLSALTGEGPSLADEEAMASLASLADEEGCYSAVLFAAGQVMQLICQLPEVADGAMVLMASAGEADADAAAASVREALASGQTAATRQPYDELVSDVEVEVAGDLVVVRMSVLDGRDPGIGYRLLTTGDPLVPGTAERGG